MVVLMIGVFGVLTLCTRSFFHDVGIHFDCVVWKPKNDHNYNCITTVISLLIHNLQLSHF